MDIYLPGHAEPIFERGPSIARQWHRTVGALMRACGLDHRAPIYTDIYVDPLSMNASGSLVTYAAIVGTLIVPMFPAASDASLYFQIRLPNHYRDGTALKPYFEWAPVSAAVGNVVWQFEYATSANAAAVSSATSENSTSAAPGVTNQKKRVELSSISGTNRVKGDSLICRIARLGANAADTYGANAALLAFGFKQVRDGHGEAEAHP